MPEKIGPQHGPQSAFMSCRADIAIYGGSAGGGKTFALLLEPLRNVITNSLFSAMFFRRTTTQITNPGGLWDASMRVYPHVGGSPKIGNLEWSWNRGGKIKFAHLEHESSKLNYQGSELVLLCFDELTHFSQSQFWYMVSRNRSMSGVPGYVRCTCNPDADSWVADFISWWIDQESGLAIPERSGVIRWVLRINDSQDWGDDRDELIERWRGKIPDEFLLPKSVTFVPSKLTDNKLLMTADPAYMANLLALPTVERERLLGGNWRIRPSAGLYFQRRWVKVVEELPRDIRWVRAWDLAATPKTETNDPDFTESVLMGIDRDKRLYIADHTWMFGTPAHVEAAIKREAERDRRDIGKVITALPQDPGQAGVSQKHAFGRLLLGFDVKIAPEGRSSTKTAVGPSAKSAKISRFGPFSAQCEAGNVYVLKGAWNGNLFDRLEAFPEARHDDTADCCSRAFGILTGAGQPARFGRFPIRR